MTRITRTAGCTLALVVLSLSAFTAAHAQTERYNYGYCYGIGGPPRVEVITRAFALGPEGVSGSASIMLSNAVFKRYGRLRENGCSMYPTAAEAEAKHRELIDQIVGNLGSAAVAVVNWIPKGATALSAPVKEPEPAAPKPPVPAPVAPAADTAVKYDIWGKPIPTTAWWVCESHLNKYFYVSAPFFAATDLHTAQDIYVTFMDDLIKKYHQAGTATCNKFATQAEAEQSNAKQAAEASGTGYQYHPIDWKYAPGAPAAAAAPAPANARVPAASAEVTPKSVPVAAVAKPASPAPAKAATAVAKPAVYVICRADWNPDLRRFYNPPVDGRGAGYPEWQASWHKYLVDHYGFKESNFGCGKYPTREAAQTDFDSWVAAARASPTVNGLPSPVIITNWKY